MGKKEKPEVVDSSREKAGEELFLRQSDGDHGLRKNEQDETDLHLDTSHEELSLQHVQQGSGQDNEQLQYGADTTSEADSLAEAGMQSRQESDSVQAHVDVAVEVPDASNAVANAANADPAIDDEPAQDSQDTTRQPRSTIEQHSPAGDDNAEQESAAALLRNSHST